MNLAWMIFVLYTNRVIKCIYIYIYIFFFLAKLCGLQDFSSLTRD